MPRGHTVGGDVVAVREASFALPPPSLSYDFAPLSSASCLFFPFAEKRRGWISNPIPAQFMNVTVTCWTALTSAEVNAHQQTALAASPHGPAPARERGERLNSTFKPKEGETGTVSDGRMREIAVGSLPSDTSLGERAVRDMTESETECSEVLDEVVLGRIASLPLEPFPPRDFRGKFKKMRHKKRPTILESRCHFDFTQL